MVGKATWDENLDKERWFWEKLIFQPIYSIIFLLRWLAKKSWTVNKNLANFLGKEKFSSLTDRPWLERTFLTSFSSILRLVLLMFWSLELFLYTKYVPFVYSCTWTKCGHKIKIKSSLGYVHSFISLLKATDEKFLVFWVSIYPSTSCTLNNQKCNEKIHDEKLWSQFHHLNQKKSNKMKILLLSEERQAIFSLCVQILGW